MSPFRFPAIKVQLGEKGAVKEDVQLLRTGTFYDDRYGKLEITPEILLSMKKNFDDNVRGIDLTIDYKHDSDNIAAGWIKGVYLSDDNTQLWAKVEWTPNGQRVLADKEFRYLSADFHTDYQDNESLQKFGPTLFGAGLTNRPVVKNMEPAVTLKENGNGIYAPTDKDLSELTEAEKDGFSKEVAHLVNRGHDQKQAVAAAYNMQKKGQLSENQRSLSMKTVEQLQKELDAEKVKNVKLSSDLAAKLPAAPAADDPNPNPQDELLKKIQALEGQLKEMSDKNAQYSKQLNDMSLAQKMSEKKSEFTKLLTEGKAVPAQEKAFMDGDMSEFIKLSSAINTNPRGHGGEPPEATGTTDSQINELANKKMSENKNLDYRKAVSQVLHENPELARQRRAN